MSSSCIARAADPQRQEAYYVAPEVCWRSSADRHTDRDTDKYGHNNPAERNDWPSGCRRRAGRRRDGTSAVWVIGGVPESGTGWRPDGELLAVTVPGVPEAPKASADRHARAATVEPQTRAPLTRRK